MNFHPPFSLLTATHGHELIPVAWPWAVAYLRRFIYKLFCVCLFIKDNLEQNLHDYGHSTSKATAKEKNNQSLVL